MPRRVVSFLDQTAGTAAAFSCPSRQYLPFEETSPGTLPRLGLVTTSMGVEGLEDSRKAKPWMYFPARAAERHIPSTWKMG